MTTQIWWMVTGVSGCGLTGGGRGNHIYFLRLRRLRTVALAKFLPTFLFGFLHFFSLESLSQSGMLLCCFKIKPVCQSTNQLQFTNSIFVYQTSIPEVKLHPERSSNDKRTCEDCHLCPTNGDKALCNITDSTFLI